METITIPSPSAFLRRSPVNETPSRPLPRPRPRSRSRSRPHPPPIRSTKNTAKRPLASTGRPLTKAAVEDGGISKPKQSKSRNGCITCKGKRLKCDESKPTCEQCRKRNVQCGGYSKAFKWRSFEEANFTGKSGSRPKKGKTSLNFVIEAVQLINRLVRFQSPLRRRLLHHHLSEMCQSMSRRVLPMSHTQNLRQHLAQSITSKILFPARMLSMIRTGYNRVPMDRLCLSRPILRIRTSMSRMCIYRTPISTSLTSMYVSTKHSPVHGQCPTISLNRRPYLRRVLCPSHLARPLYEIFYYREPI